MTKISTKACPLSFLVTFKGHLFKVSGWLEMMLFHYETDSHEQIWYILKHFEQYMSWFSVWLHLLVLGVRWWMCMPCCAVVVHNLIFPYAHTSPIRCTKIAILFWFELRTPSTPSIGLHPSMLAQCYWHSLFENGYWYHIANSYFATFIIIYFLHKLVGI